MNRQGPTRCSTDPLQMLTEWSKTTNATGMSQLGDLFLDLVKDIDRVVAVNRQMLFSTTIGEARSWGDTLQEQDFLEVSLATR